MSMAGEGSASEWTFAMVKPDAVRRGLVGQIISRFEKKGLNLVGLMITWPTRSLIEAHYQDEKGEPHFEDLVEYMTSGPCVPMVWEGPNAVAIGRILIGTKDPAVSTPGSIRGDLALGLPKTVVHGARSPEEAERELALWFNGSASSFIYRDLIGSEADFSDAGADSENAKVDDKDGPQSEGTEMGASVKTTSAGGSNQGPTAPQPEKLGQPVSQISKSPVLPGASIDSIDPGKEAVG